MILMALSKEDAALNLGTVAVLMDSRSYMKAM